MPQIAVSVDMLDTRIDNQANGLRILDYCSNFEYFRQNKNG